LKEDLEALHDVFLPRSLAAFSAPWKEGTEGNFHQQDIGFAPRELRSRMTEKNGVVKAERSGRSRAQGTPVLLT
jgi:hypothetical protein